MRSVALVLLACMAAFGATVGAATGWTHYQDSRWLNANDMLERPYMGASIVIDDDDLVIDAVDSGAVGLHLDQDLSALALRIPEDKPCISDDVDGHAVTVCSEGLRLHGQPRQLDFNIDNTRSATLRQLQSLAGSPGVKSVRVQAGQVPKIKMQDGTSVDSTYARVSVALAREVIAYNKQASAQKARICAGDAARSKMQSTICGSRT